MPASRRWSRRLDDWPGLVVRTARGPGAASTVRARRAHRGRRPGRHASCAVDAWRASSTHEVRLADRGPPQRRQRPGRHRRLPGGRRTSPRPSLAGLASFTGVGRRLERKGEVRGRRGLRRLRPPPHGHPRDPRRRPPARARSPGLGRLRAADLPPDRGAAGRLRRGPGGRGRRRHRRHLGRPRPGHHDRQRCRARRGRRAARARARRRWPRDRSRRRRPGWRAPSATATWSW